MPKRCGWCEDTFEDYVKYHDEEWGVPVHDDRVLFEFLVLESAQAGLSWSTILKKRAGYQKAFASFDVQKVADFGESKVQKLLLNDSIIRYEQKIRSAINNAQQFIQIQEEFGSFDEFLWSYVDGQPLQHKCTTMDDVPDKTDISKQLSHDLKNRGFKFIGSTTMYAYMQSVGLVNDHLTSCFRYQQVKDLK